MSDTNKVTLEAGLSVDKLIEQLRKAREEAVAAQKEMNETIQKTKSGADEASRALGNALGRIEAQRKEIAKLNEELEKIRKSNASSFDNSILVKYQDQIKALEDQLKKLKTSGSEGVGGITEAVGKAEKSTAAWSGKIKEVTANFLKTGAIIAVFGLITTAIKELTKSIFGLSEAEKARRQTAEDLQKISVQSQQTARAERVEIEALLVIAKDKTKSDIEREAAVRKINDQMPDYIGFITLESIETGAATAAIDTYIKHLEAKARAQAYISVIQKRYNELIELEAKQQEINNKLDGETGKLADIIRNGIQKQIDLKKEQISTLEQSFKVEIEGQNAAIDLEKEKEKIEKDNDDKRRIARSRRSLLKKLERDEEKKAAEEAKKAEADRLKALAEQEAMLKRIADLEKQLAQVRVQLLDAGKERDVANENARFNAAIESLQLLKNARKTSAEETKLINQIIEAQQELHYKNLRAIDTKYYDDAIKAFQQAQDAIDKVLLKDQDKEIADLNARYEKIISSINEARKKVLSQTNNPFVVSFINSESDSNIAAITEQQRKERDAIILKYNLKEIEEAEKLSQALNDILKVQGLSEEKLTEVKEVNKLNITIEFAKKKLALLKAAGEEENALQIAQLEKAIQDAEKGLAKLTGKNKDGDLLSFLGLDEEGAKKVKEFAAALSAFGGVAESFFDTLIDGIDRQIDAIRRVIDALEDKIDAQKEAVDREKELAEEGFANNLALEEQRLAALEKQKEKELEHEKKLIKEKQALQRAQIIADGFSQASNLVTASSEIFKVLSKLGPIGVGIAIAAIATMISGFVAAKVNAFKAVGDTTPKFKKGGGFDLYNALDGGSSHEQGGVDVVDNRSGKKLAELEGNEKLFVVNKGSSKKYEPLLDAINKDELSGWSYDALRKQIVPTGIKFRQDKVQYMVSGQQSTVNGQRIIPESKTVQYLEKIARTNEEMLKLEKDREEIIETADKTIYKKGNITRVIHKKKDS